jgi:hypothetical protein
LAGSIRSWDGKISVWAGSEGRLGGGGEIWAGSTRSVEISAGSTRGGEIDG